MSTKSYSALYSAEERRYLARLRRRHEARQRAYIERHGRPPLANRKHTRVYESDPDSLAPITSQHGCLGGGRGYYALVHPTEADYWVTCKGDLLDSQRFVEQWHRPKAGTKTTSARTRKKGLIADGSGLDTTPRPVVYIAPGATIGMGGSVVSYNSQLTLASNRGISGAAGGSVEGTQAGPGGATGMINARAPGSRFCGFQLVGPHLPFTTNVSIGDAVSGLMVEAGDVEVDNMHIAGWPKGGCAMRDGGQAHGHHSVVVDNTHHAIGYGYQVRDTSAMNVFEYVFADNNRHTTASGRNRVSAYTLRHTYNGSIRYNHAFDVHGQFTDKRGPGGRKFLMENCTTAKPSQDTAADGKKLDGASVVMRGYEGPIEGGVVQKMHFRDPDKRQAIRQMEEGRPPRLFATAEDPSKFRNISINSNSYGGTAALGIGAPDDPRI